MKDILILGGTGAMGVALVEILSEQNRVYITSRKTSRSQQSDNIQFITGNAMELDFLKKVTSGRRFSAIVDFMNRKFDNLKNALPILLDATNQYVFISSARVYAESDEPIRETTPRLLDSSSDQEFLSTNEYSLAKAREEDLLNKSGRKNFTIIRPSVTYNDYRLQLGAYEKEQWLYRVLQGRTLVFSKDFADKITTMTHGDDVAKGIASIIGQPKALGETFHITSPDSLTWKDVLDIYVNAIEEKTGMKVKVKMTEKTSMYAFESEKWRLKYCKLFNRRFDNSKIAEYVDVKSFIKPKDGLRQCVQNFIYSPRFSQISLELESMHDRISNEKTPLSEFNGVKLKVHYWMLRNIPWLARFIESMAK